MRISDWSSDVCSSDLMGFSEQDHAFEVCASPLENLLQARALVVALGPERRIGEEKDAARHADRLAERKGVERLDIDRKSAKRAPVAPGIFKERRAPRYPDRALVAAVPLVPNDRSAFAALAHARPVADEETHAIGGAFGILDQQVAGGEIGRA